MSSDWWSKKLTGQPASYPPVAQPAPQIPQQFQQPVQPPVQQPAQPQQPRLPQSAMNASRCPGCGSGNYGGATPESRPRCYDCGYPITQSGTGIPGINQGQASGPTQAAKQVQTGGWNPTTIIGKID